MRSFRRIAASLLLLGIALSAHADWAKVRQDFVSAKSRDEAVEQLNKDYQSIEENGGAEDLYDLIDDYKSASTKAVKDLTYDSIENLINSNADAEEFTPEKNADALAKDIKSKNPLYKTEKESSASTWIQKLFERLKNLASGPSNGNNQNQMPQVPAWVSTALVGAFYILAALVVGALIYVLTKIPWAWTSAGRAKKRARGGMLEEGEVLLSEDEYMLEANRLIAEGRFREACRALYLASLLRIDAARIARFEPTQTNWEHLRRIETSKTRPQGLEFRPATKAFDHAWYGHTANSIADVAIFQETYLTIKSLTEAAK